MPVAALLFGAGCYRTVSTTPASLAPGASVQLYLTPQGETDLAPRLGPETIAVEGRVEATGGDSVALVISRTRKRLGATVPWIGERVTIPTRAIAHTEQRVVDRRRSLLVAVTGAVAGAAAIAVLIAQHGAGSGDQGGGPVTPTP